MLMSYSEGKCAVESNIHRHVEKYVVKYNLSVVT